MLIYLRSKIINVRFMYNSFLRRLSFCVCLNCVLVILLGAQNKKNIQPLALPIALSGNFGELRATHFHAGVDFRTGGREGHPVLCVNDGYAVRVNVSHAGYGQALYIEHADGRTTVYGHLQSYNRRVEDIIREIQYRKESFAVDEDIRDQKIFFRQGDTIAYSGNTGSSGGPHLHFEIRDTRSERLINPLHYYKIKDVIPPKIKGLYLHAISEEGNITMLRECPVKTVNGTHVSFGKVVVPAGQVGISIFAEDYMNNSGNKLGIYEMRVLAGGDTIFSMRVDTLAFDQSYLINEMKDFWHYKKKETVYRCFGNYQARLVGVSNKNKGIMTIEKGESLPVKFVVADINGNRATAEITLVGGEYDVKAAGIGNMLACSEAHLLELPEFRVELEPYSLPYSVRRKVGVEKDTIRNRNIYVIGEDGGPLLKKAHLSISGIFSDKSLICEMDGNSRLYPLPTSRDNSGIYCKIGYLGKYTVAEDRILPEITYMGEAGGRLKFKIRDGFSGIGSYRGEVNGKWCLFVYDAKSGSLSCSTKEPVFERGKVNEIKVTVEDKVGNVRELKTRLSR